MPGVSYVAAQQVLALIVLCKEDYVIQGWHGALLTMGFALAAIYFNTSAIGKLPVLEGLVRIPRDIFLVLIELTECLQAVCLHIFGFFAFVVVLWVMGPRADASVTFTQFNDSYGWGNLGLATLIGIVSPTSTFLGSDSAVHLSEELKDAAYILPRAMVTSAIINCK